MNAVEIDQRRSHVHGMWAAVAPRWADYADDVDQRGEQMTKRILELAEVRSGQHVLELASGPGGAGLVARGGGGGPGGVVSEVVGAHGRGVIWDVVPEMVEAAAARARRRGLSNVETTVLDLEA